MWKVIAKSQIPTQVSTNTFEECNNEETDAFQLFEK